MNSYRVPSPARWIALGLVIALVLAAAPCAVAGVFYKWIDHDWVVHLTDDLAKIPKNHRDGGQEIVVSGEPNRPVPQTSPSPESEAEKGKPSGDLDLKGHDRQWWQSRMQEWRNRKANAEGKLADARDRLRRERFSDANVGTYQRQRDIADEISNYEEQIREAERMLTDELPEEARKAGAPPGWLRE
jgi:hypothetical protein